jgi:hypothetical protein
MTHQLGCWSYLRATLITLALSSQCVSALPDKPLTAEKLARPEGRRALRWLGFVTGEQLIAWSERGVAVRRWLLAPLASLESIAGLRQRWNLFLTVGEEAYRIRIEARTPDDAWHVVYRANQLDSLELAPLLSYRRLRGMYNPNKYGAKPEYAAFTSWLTQRVLHDHPEYTALRVGMERVRADDTDTLFVMEQAR